MSFSSWLKTYFNFSVALLAPVILFYLIVVLPSFISNSDDSTTIIILDDNTTVVTLEDIANGTTVILSDGSGSSDDTFLERILPSDLFIVAGLFTYPAAMVFYFLYKRGLAEEIDSIQKELQQQIHSDIAMLKSENDKEEIE